MDIAKKLNTLMKLIKHDIELAERLSRRNKTIVFQAADTGLTITIKLKNGDISGSIYDPEKYDIKFVASEDIHFRILNGDIDPDGAFFSRKIKIYGSLLDTVRFKNECLGKIQTYFKTLFEEK